MAQKATVAVENHARGMSAFYGRLMLFKARASNFMFATTNILGLEKSALSDPKRIVQLHGSLWDSRKVEVVEKDGSITKEQMRSVKLYGEPVNNQKLFKVCEFALQKEVVVVVIGSSGKVTNDLLTKSLTGKEKFFVNPDKECIPGTTEADHAFVCLCRRSLGN